MNDTERKLNKLEQIINLVDTDYAKTNEVAIFLAELIKAITNIKSSLKSDISSLDSVITAVQENLLQKIGETKDRLETLVGETKKLVSDETRTLTRDISKRLADEVYRLEGLIAEIPQFDPVTLRADTEAALADLRKLVSESKLITAEQIRDNLESLTGDSRLDKSAIKGLDDWLSRNIQPNRVIGGGMSGINLYASGTKIGAVKAINFANTTASKVNGLDTITVLGSGTFYSQTPVGAINGSNKTYTTSHTITTVFSFAINGQFIHPVEYSLSGSTITFVTALDASLSGTSFTIVYQ